MTNTRILAFVAILAIAALTAWRIRAGKVSDRFKTAWSAGILILIISITADLDPGLGAAVGVAVMIGVLGKAVTGTQIQAAINSKSGAQAAQPTTGHAPSAPFPA